MKIAIDMNVQYLKVFRDSEIIVKHVRNDIHSISIHLRNYKLEVWNLVSRFLAFNISSIPCSQNASDDRLSNVASRLIPFENFMANAFFIELIYRTSMIDNVTNW